MSNIVEMPRREPLIWVCKCGCSTFKLYDSDEVECAQCGVISPAEAEWVKDPTPKNPAAPASIERVIAVASSVEMTLRRLLKDDPNKLVVLIAIEGSGKTITWADDCDTPERIAWLDRQLASARKMLVRGQDDGKAR